MAEFKRFFLLKNSRGQSLIEYVLLLMVLSSIGYTFYNNKRFKDFLSGNRGFFTKLREGMSYSYRYGREYNANVDYDQAVNFNYQTNKHDTYLISPTTTRFFAGKEAYGK